MKKNAQWGIGIVGSGLKVCVMHVRIKACLHSILFSPIWQ